jgi:parallel beta-helix repeat protein
MTLDEARKILGLGPDQDPRPHLEEFQQARERIAEMVRTAPNETLAMRYQQGLLEFDRALASVREYLEAIGLLPRKEEIVIADSPAKTSGPITTTAQEETETETEGETEEAPPLPARKSRVPSLIAWMMVLLTAAIGSGWLYLKIEDDKRLMLQAELAHLENTGAVYIENRRWPEAIQVFQQIETLSPNSEIAAVGRRSIEAGMAEEQSQFVGYWTGQAQASFEAGLLDDAETAARQVIAKFPKEPQALEILGKISVSRAAENRQIAIAQARAKFDQRQWNEAIQMAEVILRDNPKEEAATTLISDAKAALIKEEADRTRANELLAQARERDQGQFDQQALDWLREAAALAPGNTEITAMLEKMASYSRTLRVPSDFPTPAEAISHARDNDRIVIGPGEWLGPLVINNSIEIQGAGPTKTIIECPADSGSALSLGPNAKGARIAGITLRHASFDPSGERFSAALVRGGNVTFVDCRFSDASGHGLAVIESGHVIVNRCRFSDNGWNGIAAIGAGSLLEARESECLGNFEHGIESWDGAAVILSNNRCEGNSRNGIHADNGTASATIENNRLLDNREFGLVLGSAAAGRITGNTARGNLLGGMVIRSKSAAVPVTGNEITRNGGPGLILERGLPAAAYNENSLSSNKGKSILADADLNATVETQEISSAPQPTDAAPAPIDPP